MTTHNTQLQEDTTGAAAPEIATSDENLSLQDMFQQVSLPSLGRQIFSVVPMEGPTAALFNVRRKDGTENSELVRNEVEVFPTTGINTGLTEEVIQDLKSQYGKETKSIIGPLLRGLANDQENAQTLTFLGAKAKADADLQLSDSLNAETNLFEVTQRVHELILKINSTNLRSYDAFAVLPYQPLGGILGLSKYVGAGTADEEGLFVTKIGKTSFFLNPDPASITAYVGLRDKNPSKSSAVFSPYVSTIINSQNYDTGAQGYHIFNRFAITESPLSVTDNEMIYKFDILI